MSTANDSLEDRNSHFRKKVFQPLLFGILGLGMNVGLAASDTPASAKKDPERAVAIATDDLSYPSIVGGREVRDGAWRRNYRWTVAMVPSDSPTSLRCGGTLIDRRWVLTAAHCVEELVPTDISIRVGSPNMNDETRIVPVTGIIPHPDYNSATFDNDVALLRLAEGVGLPTVAIATRRQTNELAARGERATILGWGRTSEGGALSNRLMRATPPVTGQQFCNNAYSGEITSNMICAGRRQGGVDACQGDSGGPMVVQDAEGNWLQVGITSFGIGCARPNLPGVYARVANYRSWIRETLAGQATCFTEGLPEHIRTPEDFDCFGLAANDDSSAGPIPIGFPINFGGETYEDIYVNNNGNLTFGGNLWEYTPMALGSVRLPIVAPFFADVDTRAAGSQIVYYGSTRIDGNRAFMAIWQNVGYYNTRMDKRNTFQVALIERRRNSGDFFLEFNYAKLEWETGDASGGIDGLGGDAARAGWSTLGTASESFELRGSGSPGKLIDTANNPLVERRGGRQRFSFSGGVQN